MLERYRTMKNSLFKRAIAVAASLPLALTQCLTYANAVTSDAVQGTAKAVQAEGAEDITIESLLKIDADKTISEWTVNVSAALTEAGAKSGSIDLTPYVNKLVEKAKSYGPALKAALDKYGIKADMIIGCAGGGSNLGGLISPFAGEVLRGEANYDIIAVEPASCPSLTRGKYAYDFCDTGKVCPLAKMYTLGSGFIPSANHAGGLRYHGMSSVVSELYDQGILRATSVEQTKVFEAAQMFARVKGILPAPESSHAIRVAIDEALKCKETGEAKNIVFGLTGTGYFDMYAYKAFNDGTMGDYIPTDEDLKRAFDTIPKF